MSKDASWQRFDPKSLPRCVVQVREPSGGTDGMNGTDNPSIAKRMLVARRACAGEMMKGDDEHGSELRRSKAYPPLLWQNP